MKTMVVAASIGLAACGGSGGSDTTTTATTQQTTTTAATPKPAEPKGKLSPGEYTDVRAAYKRLAKLEGVDSLKRSLRLGAPACNALGTQTELVQSIRGVCVQFFRVIRAFRSMEVQNRECKQALDAGDVSCFSLLFRAVGRSARVSGVREREMNRAIRRRTLRGACARELSSSRSGLANTTAITHDAFSAAHAAEARDGAGFTRAAARLQADLKVDQEGTIKQSLARLATCRG